MAEEKAAELDIESRIIAPHGSGTSNGVVVLWQESDGQDGRCGLGHGTEFTPTGESRKKILTHEVGLIEPRDFFRRTITNPRLRLR